MIRKIVVFSSLFFSSFLYIHAQNELDIIRYSFQTIGSTARAYGAGGAFGAIGADVSSAAINPAGMARFRSSSFNMSTSFYNSKNTATYINSDLQENKFNFNVPSIGFVINNPAEDFENKNPEGFVNFVIGFNMNRLNNFHKRSIFSANNNSSISENWAERASRTDDVPDNFSRYSLEYLAFQSWMIDADSSSLTPRYISAYGNNAINVNQSGLIQTRGGLNDYNFSLAANYKHLVLFGIALGAKSVRYIENNNFTENDLKTSNIRDVRTVTLEQYLKTSGLGLNAKLGVNICPTEKLRLGYAYHSPTVFNLKDSYSYTISSRFDQNAINPFGFTRQGRTVGTEATVYEYKITTPARHLFSLGLVDKELGFLSMDIETVNYTSGSLQPKDPTEEPFLNENLNVKRILNSNVVNLRFGAEYVMEQYRFRAGYARYPSPYKTNAVPFINDLVNNIYTLGFGIKTKNYSFDFAYVNTGYADYTVPYTLNNLKPNQQNQTMTNNVRASNVVLSMSIRLGED
jgi:hypothetical protein